MTSDRAAALDRLIAQAGFAGAERAPLPGDASTRRYVRLSLGGRSAMVMDAPPSAESAPCPPQATPAERKALGYNAEARLAASRVEAFVAVAAWLKGRGLSAPEVYAFDLSCGLAVIEDLGEGLAWDLIERQGADAEPIYAAAIDALAVAHAEPPPALLSHQGAVWPLLGYDRTAMLAEADLMLDWFAGRRMGLSLDAEAREEWAKAWAAALSILARAPIALALRDMHSQNLLWLPERAGPARAGLLDFQDALAGHPAYDLVSLLEDARRDVDPLLAEAMIERYLAASGLADAEAFRAAYCVLGAQRNAKIAGIFCRLALRDGKERYLAFLPRVLGYLERDLAHECLRPVADWFARRLPASRWREAVASEGAAA